MGKAGSSCPIFNQHLVLHLLYPAAVPFFKKWIYLHFFLPSLAPLSFIPQCLLSSPPALSYKHGYPRYPSSQGKSGAVNLTRPITLSHSSRKFLSSPLCQHARRHHEAAPGVYILVLSKGQDVFWHVQAPFLVDIDHSTCPDTTVWDVMWGDGLVSGTAARLMVVCSEPEECQTKTASQNFPVKDFKLLISASVSLSASTTEYNAHSCPQTPQSSTHPS